MIDAQNKTTTLYSYQNGIGANTEAILNRTLRHILYGDLYDNGGEIPSNEMHFTTLAGSVDYVGTQGDQILLSDNSVVDITATGQTFTFNVPSGKHKVKLVESVGRSSYVSVGGEALVELHNFPTLSTVTKFNFSTENYNPLPNLPRLPKLINLNNLTKVPNYLPSNIINIDSMFANATSFDQPLNNWNVSNVTDMRYMFHDATSFNQDLSMWCVSNIPIKPAEFDTGATNWTLPRPVWGTCPTP